MQKVAVYRFGLEFLVGQSVNLSLDLFQFHDVLGHLPQFGWSRWVVLFEVL